VLVGLSAEVRRTWIPRFARNNSVVAMTTLVKYKLPGIQKFMSRSSLKVPFSRCRIRKAPLKQMLHPIY